MEFPTLTLQIPFILLGRTDLVDPRGWQRDTFPIAIVQDTFKNSCPDAREGEDLASPFTIPLPAQPTSLWTLRSSQHDLSMDERAHLGKELWSYSMVLERTGIPIATGFSSWRAFDDECREVFDVLRKSLRDYVHPPSTPDALGRELGHVKLWDIVVGEEGYLRIGLNFGNKQRQCVSLEVVRNILMMLAAVERETSMMSMPSSLLAFAPLSRVLEQCEISQKRKEKRAIWHALKTQKGIRSEKRWAALYSKSKEKWIAGFEDKNSACMRSRGRKREWWDVLEEMKMEDMDLLVREVRKLGEKERRCVVGFDMEDDEEESNDTRDRFSDADLEENYGDAPLEKKQKEKQKAELSVQSLSFNGYKATLDPDEIIAYTDFIATLIHIALSRAPLQLTELCELLSISRLRPDAKDNSHANSPPNRQTHLLTNLKSLFSMIPVNDSTATFFLNHLTPLYTCDADSTLDFGTSKNPDSKFDPFFDMRNRERKYRQHERIYMPTFMQRYEDVGGFDVTVGKKLYALMAERDGQKKKMSRTKEESTRMWERKLGGGQRSMGDKQSVQEADYGEQGRRTPELDQEEKMEMNSWIDNWRGEVGRL